MKINLLALLAFVALGLSGCTLRVHNYRNEPYREPARNEPDHEPVHHGPVVVVNKQLRVPAHGWRAQLITVNTRHRVHIELRGGHRGGQGFSAYLLTPAEWQHYRGGHHAHSIHGWDRRKAHGYNITRSLQRGRYYLVVLNTHSHWTLRVRLRVTDIF